MSETKLAVSMGRMKTYAYCGVPKAEERMGWRKAPNRRLSLSEPECAQRRHTLQRPRSCPLADGESETQRGEGQHQHTEKLEVGKTASGPLGAGHGKDAVCPADLIYLIAHLPSQIHLESMQAVAHKNSWTGCKMMPPLGQQV